MAAMTCVRSTTPTIPELIISEQQKLKTSVMSKCRRRMADLGSL
jgi:hypothetical protein